MGFRTRCRQCSVRLDDAHVPAAAQSIVPLFRHVDGFLLRVERAKALQDPRPLSLIFRRKLLNLPAVHLVRAAHVLLQPSRRPLHLYISAAFCCYIDYYVYMRIYTYIKVMWYQRPSRPPLAPAPASRCKASCRGGGELTSLQVSLRIISDE